MLKEQLAKAVADFLAALATISGVQESTDVQEAIQDFSKGVDSDATQLYSDLEDLEDEDEDEGDGTEDEGDEEEVTGT